MNSKYLKAKHNDVYDQFFKHNHLIVSAPFLMTWAGDLSKAYSGLTIKQKIPLRIYVGVHTCTSGKITINDITYFDKQHEDFLHAKILEYIPHFSTLPEHISTQRKHILTKYKGIDINILSELPRGVGLGFESIISFLLSSVLNRLAGNIDHTTLEYMNTLPLEDAFKKSDAHIAQWLTDGIVFDKLIFGTIISGTKRSSIFASHYPIVSIPKDYDNKDEDAYYSLHKSFTFRFDELFQHLKANPYLPVDYGIIYSGRPMFSEQIISRSSKRSLYLNGIKPELRSIFGSYFEDLDEDELPKFYKTFITQDDNSTEQSLFGKIMGLTSIKVLYYMSKLYGSEYNEENVRYFLDALKKMRWCDYIAKESSSEYVEIVKRLTENCNILSKLLALFPNDTTIMGGTIGFALPLEGHRKDMLASISATKKEFPGMDLLYASRLDGIEYEGLKFEQDIEKDVYSVFIDAQKHVLKTINGDNIIGDYNDLLAQHTHDILLDCTSSKLYINGKKVTSDQLHSQITTIEILQLLIKNIGKDIHSKQLPLSSYSKNKNEMIGKIVVPFLKLTKKALRKNFPLICKGMIYDFYMKLDKSDIKIGVIEKINSF